MKRRALTLIELLIALSITTMMTGATFGLVSAPWREQRHADVRLEQEFHYGAFLNQLTEDVHNAVRAEHEIESGAILLVPGNPESPPIRYQFTDDRTVWRYAGMEGTPVLRNTERCDFTPASDSVTANVTVFESVRGTPSRMQRTVTLALLPAIGGVAP